MSEQAVFHQRYKRNAQSISEADQRKLASVKAAIVGCGGLGGYIAEEMARIGVGELLLVDGDCFDETNLNRQLFATEDQLGKRKVEAARERIRAVNSSVKVTIIPEWFTEMKGIEWFDGIDLVFDALDTIPARLQLENCCHSLNIPLVFSGIAGWFGLLGVSYPGDQSVAYLFGRSQERGVETQWGNPAFTPAVVASMAVAEGIKVLTDKPVSLRKAWLQVDLLAMEFEKFELA